MRVSPYVGCICSFRRVLITRRPQKMNLTYITCITYTPHFRLHYVLLRHSMQGNVRALRCLARNVQITGELQRTVADSLG